MMKVHVLVWYQALRHEFEETQRHERRLYSWTTFENQNLQLLTLPPHDDFEDGELRVDRRCSEDSPVARPFTYYSHNFTFDSILTTRCINRLLLQLDPHSSALNRLQ